MTTGERSLNNHIHGGIQALVEQSKEKISFEKMKARIKLIAALENDYPHRMKHIELKKADGTIKKVEYFSPESLSDQSTENGMKVMMTIQEIADRYELYLYYYDESVFPHVVFRSVGGRNRKEMDTYIKEIEDSGKHEKARILKAPIKSKLDKKIDIW